MEARKMTVAALVLTMLALVWSSPALAFEEENQPDPDACMGPTDPFCPRPPGSGSGDWPPDYVAQCYVCEVAASDNLDLAGSAYWACHLVDPLVQNGYTNCLDGTADIYCNFSSSMCQVA